MRLNEVFLGKPLHWLPWPIIAVALWLMDHVHMHVTEFNTFTFILLGMAAVVVALLVGTSRPGERVTREPIEGHDASGDWGEE